MTGHLLTIVTITFRNADGLRRTLESVREQAGLDGRVQVVVVDGGSDDGTDDLVAALLPAGGIYVSEPDRGVYDAMNKGARLGDGAWLQFLNAGDTFADPSSLDAILEALAAHPDARWLVAGALHLQGGVGQPVVIPNVPHDRRRHLLGIQPHCHQSTFVRRDAFDILGGHSEDFDFVGDFDLILRLGMIEPPAELPRPVVAYEGNGMSAKRADEIPGLLHRVRVARLGFGPVGSAIDTAWTRGRSTYVETRSAISRALRDKKSR